MAQNIYSVSQVNTYIKNMFMQDFMLQSVSIKGEVSNCKYHSSGHIYFTLKDDKGALDCVMFYGNVRTGLNFRLADGMQVVVSGSVDTYERNSKYQLYAKKIVQDGVGLLYERFEALKQELQERGMFAPEYKQPIPKYIKTLGVVTAPTGAAVRDIINVTRRRNPYVQIILYPAIVQGAQAPESIVKGIKALEKKGVDLMIVGRGGGSLEDLWGFNEEIVAQAVFDCSVPIISAVGHETDTTIIDFVSDLRAPTPSAAAELAVFDVSLIEDEIADIEERLDRQMRRKVLECRNKVEGIGRRMTLLSPRSRIRDMRMHSLHSEERLENLMKKKLTARHHQLAVYIQRMKGLSPLGKLNGGYSYVEGEAGRAIRKVGEVQKGDTLTIHVTDGAIQATVDNTVPVDRNE